MNALPKILGNANPLHLAQFLPGIQTNSEYDAGIHIQGCESGHNQISISGVPVYNPSHILGLFSTFNSSHFTNVLIEKQSPISSGNFLGGNIEMTPQSQLVKKIGGELSIGPMSSQGTLKIPFGKKTSLYLSARGSYLNLLYGKWLKIDDNELVYGFGDYNLTFLWEPTEKDLVWIDGYYGQDNAKQTDNATGAFFKVEWGNYLGAVHWKHKYFKSTLTQSFYSTNYKNKLTFNPTGQNYFLPSSIYDYGYKATWEQKHWNLGGKAIIHRILPQTPQLPDEKRNEDMLPLIKQNCQEYSLFGECTYPIDRHWMLKGGLKGTLFVTPEKKKYAGANPMAQIGYAPNEEQRFTLEYQWQQQYLFQTGFSNMGLPTEFWFSAKDNISPQKAHSLSLTYDIEFGNGDWKLSTSLYYKRLQHQVEFIGNLLDLLEEGYQLENSIANGKGNNYGFNILLNKLTGKWNGWVSYSFGKALRTFDHPLLTKTYPSNHERVHELNLLTVYRPTKKWELSATFVVASGTPFTAPDYIYFWNGHLISHFGEHNANRLNPYMRLDLSANYAFKKTKKKEHGLNFSLYNTTMKKNDLFYRMKFHNGRFAYRPVRFLLPILPSINYYCKF